MEEKTYKLLGGSGALNIAVGAVVLVYRDCKRRAVLIVTAQDSCAPGAN